MYRKVSKEGHSKAEMKSQVCTQTGTQRKYTAFLKYTHEIKPFHVELNKIIVKHLVLPALELQD